MGDELNFEISNEQIKNFEEKPNKSNSINPLEIDTSQSTDKQEKIVEKGENKGKTVVFTINGWTLK